MKCTCSKALIIVGAEGLTRRNVVPTNTPPLRKIRLISAIWQTITESSIVNSTSFVELESAYKSMNFSKKQRIQIKLFGSNPNGKLMN